MVPLCSGQKLKSWGRVKSKPAPLKTTRVRHPLRRDEGEFDAAADGVDALGADADAIAEFPGELESGFAAGGAAASAGVATGDSDDGVVAFAIDATGVGGFFDGGDGQKSFHENFEEFDEAAVFLHGDDQGIVFVAEMLLHKLRGFPTD